MIRSSSMGCGRGRLPACPFSKKSKEIDMTPDNLKYGHTPTGPEVIAGVTLKDVVDFEQRTMAKSGPPMWTWPSP